MLLRSLRTRSYNLRLPYTEQVLEPWQWLPAVAIGLICAILPLKFAVAAIGGIGGGLLLLSHPLVGLVLAAFAGPLGAWEEIFVGGIIGRISSGQIILFATIGLWLVRSMLNGRILIPHTKLNLPLFVFIVMSAVTLFDVYRTPDSLAWTSASIPAGIRELLKWVEMLLIIWMIREMTRKYRPKTVIQAIVAIMLAVGVMQAVWGIFQFIIRGTGPSHFIIFGRLYRGTGSFQQPNPFGGFMSLCACLAIGTLIGSINQRLQGRDWTRENVVHVLRTTRVVQILIPTILILLFGLIGSWSRGAWINFAAGFTIMAFFFPRSRKRGLILVGGFILIGGMLLASGALPASFQYRLTGFLNDFNIQAIDDIDFGAVTPQNFAVMERLAHWKAGIDMARESIWLGLGFGSYEIAYNDFNQSYWKEPLGHAHNYYINLMAEMGLWGLCSYLFMWGMIIWYTIQAIVRAPAFERGIALGLIGVWGGLSVHHLLDNLYVNNLFIHYGILLALLVMIQLSASDAQKSASV